MNEANLTKKKKKKKWKQSVASQSSKTVCVSFLIQLKLQNVPGRRHRLFWQDELHGTFFL